MIDLTPLEVRKKKGDFRRQMRGYDPALVDDFLDLVADRLEQLVRENMTAQERLSVLETQVKEFREREKALTEALVSAQEIREQGRKQIEKEVELARRQAEQDAEHIRASALQAREREEQTLRRLRARQGQLIQSFRTFLERELAELAITAETLEVTNAIEEAEDDVSGGGSTDRKSDRAASSTETVARAKPLPTGASSSGTSGAASGAKSTSGAAPRSSAPSSGSSQGGTASQGAGVPRPGTATPASPSGTPNATTQSQSQQPKSHQSQSQQSQAQQSQSQPSQPQPSQPQPSQSQVQANAAQSGAAIQSNVAPPIAAAPTAGAQSPEELTLALNTDFLDIDALAPGAEEDKADDDSIIDGGWVSLIEKRDADG